MDYYKASLEMHEKHKGKMETKGKVSVRDKDDLSTAYTPGVAEPCRQIEKDPENIFKYTNKSNTVAVISDGSAVLGLGNIGAEASIPVMDGKSLLFKEFAGIDAFPVCIETQDPDEIVMIAKNISSTMGGINLEDISAPRCFEIEEKLQAEVDIPVFHDDQHGTAVVVSAGVINAFKLTGRKVEEAKVVINGAGSAGTAIAKMLMSLGVKDIVICDKFGILTVDNYELNPAMMKLAQNTNPQNISGDLKKAVKGRDLFVGVSAPGILTGEMIKTMAGDPVVFAMANPEPEILPEEAKKAGVAVMGTGRSDYPNQVNNVLAFPGIFKGALGVRAKRITEKMKKAAAYALAGVIAEKDLAPDNIIPSAFHPGVADIVAQAVADAWEE
ncbi:MAG: NADP-dependent malic enzyme [Eubacteriaceae bacterium]|nr:NADP-dependent malic enzyme [Eubacteriaceae bacterium]